ncbi:hypothetical protein AB0L57_05755 [Nocardia sp. NPDC052254]|uniref:hypothetical protein n=1 Tax=Nocardia sp. NPDC052254 TaxID=3155681 RepID=UPI0034208DD3
MPSAPHEVVIDMFSEQPALVAALLTALGCSLPEYESVESQSEKATVLAPTEYYADAVLAFHQDDTPVLGVVVEVQLRRDPDKVWSWPVYIASLRARMKCPVLLLIICPDRRTARWAAQPLELGFGNPPTALCPLVLDPDAVPVVVDPEQAVELPELAVLSAVAHPTHPQHENIWKALVAALGAIGSDPAMRYYDLVLTMLPAAVRPEWEAFMSADLRNYEFRSDFARRYIAEGRQQGRAEGEARGEAKFVLRVLETRGVPVSDRVREAIVECTDHEQLDKWLRLALEVSRAEDLLG